MPSFQMWSFTKMTGLFGRFILGRPFEETREEMDKYAPFLCGSTPHMVRNTIDIKGCKVDIIRIKPRHHHREHSTENHPNTTTSTPTTSGTAIEDQEETISATNLPSTGITRWVIFFHGGAYCTGSSTSHAGLAYRIAEAVGGTTNDCAVMVPNYRLAPENPYPGGLDDMLVCFDALIANNVSPSSISFAGDSAGGGLAIAAILKLRDTRDASLLPAACVALCPWVDLECTGASHQTRAHQDVILTTPLLQDAARKYSKGQDVKDPYISPLYMQDWSKFPPLLIHVAEFDVLCDDGVTLAEKLSQVDGSVVKLEKWEGCVHAFHYFAALLPEANEAIIGVGEFIREHSQKL